MTLREAIKDKHDEAEKHCFVVALLNKSLPKNAYGSYLFNQLKCYKALERRAYMFNLFDGVEDIVRASAIQEDAKELDADETMFTSTSDYVGYISQAPRSKLLAHVYVRHFADMYGGQLIKAVAPGSCRMYEFKNRASLISTMRERLSNDLADEANVAFDYVLRLFDEVSDAYDIRSASSNG